MLRIPRRARRRPWLRYSVMEGQEMNQQRDLEGMSALVTGASSGIGRAAAEELGRQGAEVVVHGRDAARGSAVADTITPGGRQARFPPADLTHPDPLDDLAGQAGPVAPPCQNTRFSCSPPHAQ